MAAIHKNKIEKLKNKLDYSRLPSHIAFILDGNGRWAKKRMLPRTAGHKEGAQNLKRVTKLCGQLGIRHMTVYAFSTENWSRPKKEVDVLMDLLLNFLKNAEKELDGDDVRIKVIGDIDGLSKEIRKEIIRVERVTALNQSVNMYIALNYGGRNEIVRASQKIADKVIKRQLSVNDIDEKVFADSLYTAGVPDPELLIRTSGESRISNFLLWQLAYTEFIFTEKLWPDYHEADILEDLLKYQKVDRRFGNVK